MNKYDLNQEQINKILIQANKIGFIDILPILIYDILRVEGQHVGTSVPFMIAPLLAAIGLLLHQTTISPFERSRQGICNFTALIAHPSTGKTPALNVIKGAMIKVEAYNEVPPNKSCLTNSGSVEGLLEHLDTIPCMLAFYDESNTFLGTIGRYSNGGSSALYERSIYLTLFSAADFIDRDIKATRSKIRCPRFHMCLLGHPYFFINLLKQERFSYDDGLFQRFFMLAPTPPIITAEDMRRTPKTILSLHCIFMFIHLVHFEKNRNYTFEKDALDIIDSEFNKARRRVSIANEFDSYIGAMCGKALTHLVRLCMMLKTLNVACTKLLGTVDSTKLDITPEFYGVCVQLADTIEPSAFVIEADLVERAKRFLDYFNLNKLILSSYSIDPTGSFDQAFEKICENRPNQLAVTVQFCSLPSKTLRFMKKAFQVTFSKFNASRLSGNNLLADEARDIFNRLQNLELGSIMTEKNERNNQTVTYFKRVKAATIRQRPDLGQLILDMGLNLTNVLELLEETEERELGVTSKRTREGYQIPEPEPKRPKLRRCSTETIVKQNSKNNCPYTTKRTSFDDELYGRASFSNRHNETESEYDSDVVHEIIDQTLNRQTASARCSNLGDYKQNEKNKIGEILKYKSSEIEPKSNSKKSSARSSIETGFESGELSSRSSSKDEQCESDIEQCESDSSDHELKRSNSNAPVKNKKKFSIYDLSGNTDSELSDFGAGNQQVNLKKKKTERVSVQVDYAEAKATTSNSRCKTTTKSYSSISTPLQNSQSQLKTKTNSVGNDCGQDSTEFSDSQASGTEENKSNSNQVENGRYGKRGPYKKTLLKAAAALEEKKNNNKRLSKSPDGKDLETRQKASSRTKNFTPPAVIQPSQQLKQKKAKQMTSDDM